MMCVADELTPKAQKAKDVNPKPPAPRTTSNQILAKISWHESLENGDLCQRSSPYTDIRPTRPRFKIKSKLVLI